MTVRDIRERKGKEPIVAVTAYDVLFGRLVDEAGVDIVLVGEGGSERIAESVARLVEIGIPVMGHLGFTPQSVNAIGVRVQGRELAARITSEISAPTIGIGAGAACDGQVLVLPDMLGLNESFSPRFLKRYANLWETVRDAVPA